MSHHLDTGLDCWRAGDLRAARLAFAAAADADPHSPKAALFVALLALADDRLEEVEPALTRAVAALPDWSLPHFWLGQLAARRGDAAAALAHFKTAQPELDEYAPLFMHMGSGHMALGQLVEAQAAFSEATRLVPGASSGWSALGVAKAEAKDLPGAVADLRRAAEADPADPDPWFRLGWVLAKFGLLEDAASAYESCLKRDATNAHAWLNLGLLRARQENLPAAQAAFARAVAADPANEDAHFWLATSQAGTEQHSEAQAAFRGLADRHPENPLFSAVHSAITRQEGRP